MKNLKVFLILSVFLLVLSIVGCAGMFGPKTNIIIFSANGGSGTEPIKQEVPIDSSIILPGGDGLSFGDATFAGWCIDSDGIVTNYNAGESFTPTARFNILFARWKLNVVDFDSVTGFVNKLIWLQNNAESNGSYIIELNTNENINSQSLRYYGKSNSNITITLRGVDANRTISNLSRKGHLFSINSGVTLVLDSNITLQGSVGINGSGILKMNTGATITGNVDGSGISVDKGVFEMNGGTISGNSIGVFVGGGTFTMNDGSISGNTKGGGVRVFGGVFTMNGGVISGNNSGGTNSKGESSGSGGGVWVSSAPSIFTMNGGTISGNTSGYMGGGVFIEGGLSPSSVTFNMKGGTISGNSAVEGGGVFVPAYGIFNKTGGSITNNSASKLGREIFAGGKLKESDVGPGMNLSYSNGSISGAWDK